jgi:transcriptional regulator with XRE-family HTH domain
MTLADIGRLIESARKKHKLTQEQLARAVGVSRKTISDLENNRRPDIGLQRLLAILTQLDLVFDVKPFQPLTLNDLLDQQRRSERLVVSSPALREPRQ